MFPLGYVYHWNTAILWNKMTALGLVCSQYAARLQEQFYHNLNQ